MDNLTAEQRHKNMSHIRSRDTSIEVVLRKALWHRGIRYRKNYKELPGTPDIAITKHHIAIFCDSEFFHGKDWEALRLRLENGNNSTYWLRKIQRNMERDAENEKALSGLAKDLFLFVTFQKRYILRPKGKDVFRHPIRLLQYANQQIVKYKNVDSRQRTYMWHSLLSKFLKGR